MLNNKKRVTLNRRSSSLLLDYQAMVPTFDRKESHGIVTNEYTRQLVASALSLPASVQIRTTSPSPPPQQQQATVAAAAAAPAKQQPKEKIQLPRSLKSSLRTPRSASAPCSPTTGLKSVHFNKDNLEDVCLFRKAQTPLAISQKNIFWAQEDEEEDSSSRKKTLSYPNWPTRLSDIIDKKTKVIRIEKGSIRLEENEQMYGKILVRNLDYHKTVTIRYSFDFWETMDNCEARYHQQDDHKNNAYDVFSFKIKVPKEATTLYFAVNYKVGSKEFWDNNQGRNYEVRIQSNVSKKKILKKKAESKEEGLKARYDFGQSIHQAIIDDKKPLQQQQQLKASNTIPIPRRNKSNSSTSSSSSPTGLSCHSPLASSPTFMDLNSQSYLDLVNKYCFYSTSPSRSPMSING
ncbi:putative phosphatase regulatory subunit-domain-containing protein [Pilaira anomala]|nr:putative phosphatase regulatory subunit-domain-containing protein [Pilaira anomala]